LYNQYVILIVGLITRNLNITFNRETQMIPEKIGRYIIIAELGRGGMATVYRAKDPRFDREVAVKILPRTFLHDPQFRTRFEREAKTIAALEHAAIVPVYDFGEEDEQPFIVMRLMSGGSLADKLKNSKFSLEEAVRIITQLAPGLDAAHQRGIVHRDLKPGNILFDQYNNAFLSDFGIARLTEGDGTLTGSRILGTPAYMSPEQIQGDKAIDGRSDIYALGVIFYQMLVGSTPFQAATPAKVMMMHLLEPVPNLLKALPTVPVSIEDWFEKTLAKEPEERHTNAIEMADHLKKALRGDKPTPAPSTETVVASHWDADATQRSRPVSTPVPQKETPPVQPQPQVRTQLKEQVQVPPEIFTPPPAPTEKRDRSIYAIFGVVAVIVIGMILVISMVFSGIRGNGPLAGVLSPATPTSALAIVENNPTTTPEPMETDQIGEDEPVIEKPSATSVIDLPTATEAPPTDTPEPTATATPEMVTIGGADKIAFLNENEIWLMNVDGSDLQQITNDGIQKNQISWLPDGSGISYISGKCIWWVDVESTNIENIACFETAEYLEGFSFSPDGSQVAISLNRELYVVPFDLERLNEARFNYDLEAMAECEYLAPLRTTNNTTEHVKYMSWADDGERLIILKLGVAGGKRVDLIQILAFEGCAYEPYRLDEIPASRFSIDGYNNTPYIQSFGYDGDNLFSLVSYARNDGFGHLYIYNAETYRADEKINPINGVCCYRDPEFSPDGRYLLLVHQPFEMNAKAQLYYIPYGTIGTGTTYEPIPLPEELFQNPKEKPEPILRPVQ
jgi:serine/threonine-protein kinase